MITNLPTHPGPAGAAVTNDIHGIKPPIDIPMSLIMKLLLGAVALVVAAAIVWLVVWLARKKAAAAAVVPVIPPHERARQKLREALALIDQPRPFCILVSDTLRQYLEERFLFHAPERTTEEFLNELQATDLLSLAQKQSLGEFLALCDMVKFAKYEPGPPELQALHDSAWRLVDETEPRPAPESAPENTPVAA